MKRYLSRLLTFTMLIFFAACSIHTTSKIADIESTSEEYETKEDNIELVKQTANSPTTQLVDLIRPLSGVNIVGDYPNVLVTIRGGSNKSVSRSVSVLYVVDGMPMGNSYNTINQLVDITHVSSVKALKGGGQTVAYGRQGDGGVILIETKEIQKD